MNSPAISRQEFFAKPKYASLSNKSKEARWQQHKSAQKLGRATSGRNRSTRIKVAGPANKRHLSLAMTPCAVDYMKSLVTPFSLTQPACIPDLHAVPSKKVRVKYRGVFSTGTTGDGQCVALPACTTNQGSIVYITDATYALGPTLQNSLVAGISGPVNPKIPYGSSAFAGTTTGGIRSRLVGFGVRIRYIGPEISRSGQIVGFREPDNSNALGLTYDRVRSLTTSKTFSNKRQWVYATYRPVQPGEYEYSPFPCSPEVPGATVNTSAATLGFTISGTTDSSGNPGPAPFEFETVSFIEYIGNIDNISHTHVDVIGMSHVRNALPGKSVTDNLVHTAGTAVHSLTKSLQNAAPVIGAGVLGYHMLAKGSSAEAAEAAAAEASTAAEGGILSTVKHFGGEAFDWLEGAAPEALEVAEGLAAGAAAVAA